MLSMESRFSGKTSLSSTDIAKVSSRKRITQSHIEDGFRAMKDPHHIALRPQYHWTDQKVRVHVFTCVLALLLLSLLRRELARRGFDFSIPRMLETLGNIREVVTLFPPQDQETEPTLRTSLTHMSPEQHALFKALGLKRYTAT